MAQPYGTHITVVISSICLIMTSIITSILLYQMYHTSQSTKESQKIIRILIKQCIISSTLCIYCDDIRWIICAILNRSIVFYPLNQIMSFADLLYYIGTISFYTIAIYRLYTSFKNTIYRINIWTIRFFIITIIIQSFVAMYYCIIVALQPKEEMEANSFFIAYNSWSIIILMTNDFTLNLGLLLLFISKLNHSLSDTLTANSIQQIGSSIDTISVRMVDLITRHSLLFGLAIITNQLFFGANILLFSKIGFTSYKYHFVPFCCRSIENTANCIVLFLGLKQNRKLYFKICGKCHSSLSLCFRKSTQKTIDRNRAKKEHYHRLPSPQQHRGTEMTVKSDNSH